jgi:hypothetical protein
MKVEYHSADFDCEIILTVVPTLAPFLTVHPEVPDGEA